MFRIAVVGGGLGGLFAALSIHHHCSSNDIQIDVYEQAAQYKEIGAGVAIGPKRSEANRETWPVGRHMENRGEEREGLVFPSAAMTMAMRSSQFLSLRPARCCSCQCIERNSSKCSVRAVTSRGAATLHTNKQCRQLEVRRSTSPSCLYRRATKASMSF